VCVCVCVCCVDPLSSSTFPARWSRIHLQLLERLATKVDEPVCVQSLIEVLKLTFVITLPLGPMGKSLKPEPAMLDAHRK
jgi:hypothetical protein